MEEMISKSKIKELRVAKAWSQDQLATVSGLSLRTIQRIENEGKCSFESKRALAASFEIELNELDEQEESDVIVVADKYKKPLITLTFLAFLFWMYQQFFIVTNTLTVLVEGEGYRGLSTHPISLSDNERQLIELDGGYQLQIMAKTGWDKELHMVLANKNEQVLHTAKMIGIRPTLHVVCNENFERYVSPYDEGKYTPSC